MREISSGYINSLNDQFSEEADLMFLTAKTKMLSDDIRLVNDGAMVQGKVIQYNRGGLIWQGMPFQISILTDNDQQPTAQLQFINVDRRIEEFIRELADSPNILIEGIKASDFYRLPAPNDYIWAEISSPATVELPIRNLRISDSTSDDVAVTCNLYTYDFTQEPWPSSRAIKKIYPCIYR